MTQAVRRLRSALALNSVDMSQMTDGRFKLRQQSETGVLEVVWDTTPAEIKILLDDSRMPLSYAGI